MLLSRESFEIMHCIVKLGRAVLVERKVAQEVAVQEDIG